MLARIIEDAYDVHGRSIMQPISRRKNKVFHPTYPMPRYLTHPLEHYCSSISEISQFLRHCKYVSDQKQFNRKDYWLPPEEFEHSRKGDCEDFALWAWRQLLHLNIPCRFTIGKSGRYGYGHAWLTLQKDGQHYLMECQAPLAEAYLPRLSMVTYKPEVSVERDGKDVRYYQHADKSYNPTFREAVPLVWEWIVFWTSFWIKLLVRIPLLPYYLIRKLIKNRKHNHGLESTGAPPPALAPETHP